MNRPRVLCQASPQMIYVRRSVDGEWEPWLDRQVPESQVRMVLSILERHFGWMEFTCTADLETKARAAAA